MKQLFETLFKKITHLPWRSGKCCFRPRKWFHIIFFLLFCCHSFFFFPFFLSFFFFLHFNFTGLVCHFSLNYIILMILLLRLAQSHPWEKQLTCFCCVPTHNLRHQRACSIFYYHLFISFFSHCKTYFPLSWPWRHPSSFMEDRLPSLSYWN